MRTSEHTHAFAQLRALAAPGRHRVTADPEGFPIIAGRYGRIEWTGGPELAVYSDRSRLFARLWAVPGVRRHQTGDTKMRALFPPAVLAPVAHVIRARRARTLAPEEARRRGFKRTHSATLGRQK